MAGVSSAGVVVRHEHEGGEIPDYHQWVWMGDSVLRDKAGRPHRNGWRHFAVVRCNNPGCLGEVLVDAEEIAALVRA